MQVEFSAVNGEEELMIDGADKGCVLIPCYNEGARIGPVVEQVLAQCPNVLVVDDGSPDDTAAAAKAAGAVVVTHAMNRGKGAALHTGYRWAQDNGMVFVVTMDGDGQHAPTDVAAFIDMYLKTGTPVLVGNRMDNTETMPLIRRWTNLFMSWLLSRKMGQWIPDTQNGFRLYQTDRLPDMGQGATRFAAESEILLELARSGATMDSVPIQVIYGDEKSKIHPMKDAFRFYKMLRDFDRRVDREAKGI